MKTQWIFLLLVLLLLSSCQDENPSGGGYTLTVNALPDTLYAGSVANSSQVTAMLIKDNLPDVGKEILFTADIGEITASAITNNNGIATSIFIYNESESATATVTASYDDLQAATAIPILDNISHLLLYSECDTLFFGAASNQCQITAIFTDSNNLPVEDALVIFTTDTGEITAFENTNAQGIAYATFSYDGYVSGQANITAECNEVLAEKIIYLAPHPDLLLTAVTSVDTLYLSTGTNYCQVTASLTRNSTPVTGALILFNSDTGEISPAIYTDDNGLAVATFWYEDAENALATCQANFASLQAEVFINIVNDPFYSLEVWAEPDMIYIDSGNYDSDVFTRLTDLNGNPIVGEIVSFAASSGFIGSAAFTDEAGIAQVYYNFSGDQPEIIQITASYQNHSALGYIYVLDPEIILNVWAEPDTIYQGTSANYADIHAQLTTEFGAPLSGITITFSTTVGSILNYGTTNSQGIAISTFWYSERPDITAIITAAYQDISENTTVTILEDQLQIVFLEADPLIIYTDNDPETYSTIRARVYDSAGSPVQDAIVYFQTNLGSMALSSALTNAFGYATNMLHDNGVSGLATIYVNCDNDYSQIDVQIMDE